MSWTTADIEEFVAEQDELRAFAGTPAVFTVPPGVVTWPDGTKMNPDTGLPYDATVVPTNGPTTVTITVLIIAKQGSPMRPQAETFWDEVGMMQGMDIILDVSAKDYPLVTEATQMLVNTLGYDIVERKPFSFGGRRYRWLIYGQEK